MTTTKLEKTKTLNTNLFTSKLAGPTGSAKKGRNAKISNAQKCAAFEHNTNSTLNVATLPWGSITLQPAIISYMVGLTPGDGGVSQRPTKQAKTASSNAHTATAKIRARLPIDVSPKAVATYLANRDNYHTANWQQQRASDFIEVVQAYANNTDHLESLMIALGPELCACFAHHAVDVITGRTQNTRSDQEVFAQSALKSIALAFAATNDNFQTKTARLASENYLQAGMVFAQPVGPNANLNTARRAFIDCCKKKVTSASSSNNNISFKNPLYSAAMMVCQILASDQALACEYLEKWHYDGLASLLNIALALSPSLQHPQSLPRSLTPNGAERLITMVATMGPDEISNLHEIKAIVFREGAMQLGNSQTNKHNRDNLLRRLKFIFATDPANIIDRLNANETNNIAGNDSTKDHALAFFFAHAVFDNTNRNDPFMQIFEQFLAGMRTQMLNPDNINAKFINNERNNNWYAKRLGACLGELAAGFNFNLTKLSNSQAERQKTISMFVGLVQASTPTINLPGAAQLQSAAFNIAQKNITQIVNNTDQSEIKRMQNLLYEIKKDLLRDTDTFNECTGHDVDSALKVQAVWSDFATNS